jgi:hypothetical protein
MIVREIRRCAMNQPISHARSSRVARQLGAVRTVVAEPIGARLHGHGGRRRDRGDRENTKGR